MCVCVYIHTTPKINHSRQSSYFSYLFSHEGQGNTMRETNGIEIHSDY